jgi:AraC-like DNA-binding protein
MISTFSPLKPALVPVVTQHYFDVGHIAPQGQLLAWRERLGHLLDILPSRQQVHGPFKAWTHSCTAGDLSYADTYSDPVRVERTLGRISADSYCNYFMFTVCVDGDSHTYEGCFAKRYQPQDSKFMVLDMDQPIRFQAHRHRFSTIFAPRSLVTSIQPDADALHGRSLDGKTPFARLLMAQAMTLNEQIASMTVDEAAVAMRNTVQLFVSAFGRQAGLSGNARAALRAVIFGQIRRYIQQHLDEGDLCAETVLRKLGLPRHTAYRLFEHEGGIAAYICSCRLRAAANDIARYPRMAIKDIAFSTGFASASAFSRTFRRRYGISPAELREHLCSRPT